MKIQSKRDRKCRDRIRKENENGAKRKYKSE